MIAALLVAANLGVGLVFSRDGAGRLPVIASSAAMVAVFVLAGIALRLVLLGCAFLSLVNNLLCGSVGGILLEFAIAIASVLTVIRLARARKLHQGRVATTRIPIAEERRLPRGPARAHGYQRHQGGPTEEREKPRRAGTSGQETLHRHRTLRLRAPGVFKRGVTFS